MCIEGAQMMQPDLHFRPNYPATGRLAILGNEAARSKSPEQSQRLYAHGIAGCPRAA